MISCVLHVCIDKVFYAADNCETHPLKITDISWWVYILDSELQVLLRGHAQ